MKVRKYSVELKDVSMVVYGTHVDLKQLKLGNFIIRNRGAVAFFAKVEDVVMCYEENEEDGEE